MRLEISWKRSSCLLGFVSSVPRCLGLVIGISTLLAKSDRSCLDRNLRSLVRRIGISTFSNEIKSIQERVSSNDLSSPAWPNAKFQAFLIEYGETICDPGRSKKKKEKENIDFRSSSMQKGFKRLRNARPIGSSCYTILCVTPISLFFSFRDFSANISKREAPQYRTYVDSFVVGIWIRLHWFHHRDLSSYGRKKSLEKVRREFSRSASFREPLES